MLTPDNHIVFSLKKEWLRAGLDYALLSWTSTFNRMGKPNPYSRIQKIVLGLLAERAFEDFLKIDEIKFDTQGKTKWYEEDRYDIGINGYAVDVKSNFIDLNSNYIQNKLPKLLKNKGEWFNKCHALVPLDQFNPGKRARRAHKRDKIYVFPFIEGQFKSEVNKIPLIHAFWDYKWLKRAEHKNLPHLGNLNLDFKGTPSEKRLRIYGTSDPKKVCIEDIRLNDSKLLTTNNFFQVFSLELLDGPLDGDLDIRSNNLGLVERIKPRNSFELEKLDKGYRPTSNDWQCFNFYSGKIHLLGWIKEDDLRIIGRKYPRFTKTIEQYSEIKVDNWGCLIEELEPIKTIGKI